MTMLAALARPVLFLLLLFSMSGCFQMNRGSLEEEKDPHFLDGKKRVSSLDYDGAIESFEKALQTNPNNAAAHLELAILYDQRKNNYAAAIYHYERHLKLRPDSPMADVVNQNITACTRELAKRVVMITTTRDIQLAMDRLNSTNALLRQQLDAALAELARKPAYITNYHTNTVVANPSMPTPAPEPVVSSPNRVAATPANTQTSRPRQSAAAPRDSDSSGDWLPSFERRAGSRPAPATRATTRYTVRSGDTFAAIARRNNISMQKLQAANPGVNPSKIRAGQVLNVPER